MRARRGLGLVTAGIVLGGLLLAGPARAERAGPGPRAAARGAPATRAGAGLVDWEPPTDSVLVINQPDGSTFKASLTPAEDGGHLEQDGFTVVKADDGWWRYAEADATGALVPGRAAVGAAGAPAGLAAGLGRSV
jgi:hypothetical protein